MRSKVFKRGYQLTPEVVRAKQWFPHHYSYEEGFPPVEHVPAAGDIPEHGIVKTPEGDIVVNPGEWICAGISNGYGVYPVSEFKTYYEPSVHRFP